MLAVGGAAIHPHLNPIIAQKLRKDNIIMAHELDMTNGRANMAYVGSTPWHGLGSQLTDGAPLEVWAEEAGMAWTINTALLNYTDDTGTVRGYDDRRVLYRSDAKTPLSVVSTDYKVVQPSEVMEFFRDLIADHGFQMETAGCLFGGRKFWALARCGDSFKLGGEDEVKPYLLMATSCDGSMATAAHFTSVRVVCNNTLRMSIGDDGRKANIRVPHNAQFDAGSVKSQLGIVTDAWERFAENVERLAMLKLDRDQAIDLVARNLKAEWTDKDGNELSRDQIMDSSLLLRRIIRLYDGEALGADFASAKGTGWGLINAVTQYFDHEAGGKTDKSRAFERAHLTDRAKFKVTIANDLLALAA